MTMLGRVCALVLCAGTLAAAQARVGEQGARPAFATRVDMTTVDVRVVDAGGQPVRGLERTDLEVRAGDRAVPVLAIDYVDGVAPTAPPDVDGVSTNRPAPEPRTVVIVLEEDVVTPGLLDDVRAWVDGLPADVVVGVRVPARGLSVAPTRDRDAVTRTLTMREIASPAPAAVTTRVALSLSDAWRLAEGDANARRGLLARLCADALIPQVCAQDVDGAVQARLADASERGTQAVAHLTRLLDELARHPGRTDVVLVTGGWPLRPADAEATAWNLTKRAAAARTTVHVLRVARPTADVSGAGARQTSDIAADDARLLAAPVDAVAAGTGGLVHPVVGRAGPGLARIAAEFAGFYRVGVDVSGVPDGTRLIVRTARAGARVERHRALASPPSATPTLDIASAAASGVVISDLPLRAASEVLPADDASRVLHAFTVRAEGAREGEAALAFVVVDAAGQQVMARQATLPVSTAAPAVLSASIALPPGLYSLRVGLRDAGDRRGTIVHPLDGRPVAVGPWRSARLAVMEVAETQVGGQPLVDAVDPGTPLVFRLVLEGDVPGDGVPALFTVLDERGTTVATVAGAQDEAAGAARPVVTATFDAALPPGRYRVAVALGGSTLERSFRVE